ncbi:MAG: hypothetical protein IJ094_12490 [Bacilli bacterium]|nr:hypothetical protein [Bacilli bacterium]
MTGSKLLKKLSILCYIIGCLGIILVIVLMITNYGDDVFGSEIEEIESSEILELDAKLMAEISLALSSCFLLFEGWLLKRASNDGKKSTLLLILLILGILSTLIEIAPSIINLGFNTELCIKIVMMLFRIYALTQTLMVRKEAKKMIKEGDE